MAESNEVRFENVDKVFPLDGEYLEVLDTINLNIKSGEFISIVGNSGCGKSTLLKMLVGLDSPTKGKIIVGDRVVSEPRADVGMVFQEARLFPWLSIEKNISFGIANNVARENRQRIVKEAIELVGLHGFEKAYPAQLSGGMQQRASIARALVGEPEVLLLDEPFGALDAFTRITMQNEVLKIWEKEKRTMILVTHDIDEAIFLSDRIVILSERPGSIKEIINVDLPRPRDRSRQEFLNIRKKILTSFIGNSGLDVEYYI
ncbi:ABC transporter ATP-binding protein [Pseudobutyrivibrio sp.]|uniref:ABC transporter ATP-binding protein n=1 Tax=Pseudobutyrivibrio sp. TaxID=2014367 RepID=UPI001B508917|nr:ABC transporter ATP-binding protein [Pseudobutyrivibrio sp.]MBP3263212.1 ABC transporter ATP-binding protein [Pseudobutyrivibrio sp.]